MTEYQGLTEDRTRKPLSIWSLDRMRVPPFTAIFAAAVLAVSYAAERFDLAVYALSFWHYLVYALAFCLRSIVHNAFKRDAVLLKALSITLLVAVLFRLGVDGTFQCSMLASSKGRQSVHSVNGWRIARAAQQLSRQPFSAMAPTQKTAVGVKLV